MFRPTSETEAFDAARDLLDLLRGVGPGIAWIGSQRLGGPVFEVHRIPQDDWS
jgi:hypothetical protein